MNWRRIIDLVLVAGLFFVLGYRLHEWRHPPDGVLSYGGFQGEQWYDYEKIERK